ncbi:hypothetical protein LV478_09810 [Komagataeibacter oboediens]|uniref:hypothetical protein n=1 Tax=Komagataeibacter oboediens TaxID=65958 RepID=UPI0023DC7BDA|nr:hypothetical protein [Komagataeibacter oboediens]WEQ53752.1 hypothetical protein LV478_09810 [Komagataeibacter oboediens]
MVFNDAIGMRIDIDAGYFVFRSRSKIFRNVSGAASAYTGRPRSLASIFRVESGSSNFAVEAKARLERQMLPGSVKAWVNSR